MFTIRVTCETGGERVAGRSLKGFDVAHELAFTLYQFGRPGEGFEIVSHGVLVWGPYIVGGKYKPSQPECKDDCR